MELLKIKNVMSKVNILWDEMTRSFSEENINEHEDAAMETTSHETEKD